MLAGVNKRQPLLSEHSTLKSRLGSVVDLEEKQEVEARRRLLQSNIRELINRNLTAIRKFFRDADPYQTGNGAGTFVSRCMLTDGLQGTCRSVSFVRLSVC